MPLYYNQKNNNEPALLAGSFEGINSKLKFSEAKVFHDEDVFILAGYFDEITGLARYNSQGWEYVPTICYIKFHKSAYEKRTRDVDGNWSSKQVVPHKIEQLICNTFLNAPAIWLNEDYAVNGVINLLDDDELLSMLITGKDPDDGSDVDPSALIHAKNRFIKGSAVEITDKTRELTKDQFLKATANSKPTYTRVSEIDKARERSKVIKEALCIESETLFPLSDISESLSLIVDSVPGITREEVFTLLGLLLNG